MQDSDDTIFNGLREKLSLEKYPLTFPFKFIFPIEQLEQVKAIFRPHDVFEYKPSKAGNYLSLSCNALINHMEEIIDIYKRAAKIKGVISL
jgi:hypothetical protein